MFRERRRTHRHTMIGLVTLSLVLAGCSDEKPKSDFKLADGQAAARKWVASEFTPSTLSQAQQLAELEWFTKAAEPYRGMQINVVSETITTHSYEAQTLAKAFTEI